MNKFKIAILSLIAIVFAGNLLAQSLEDGKRFMYYERYASARDVFQKLAASNPDNEEYTYYYGHAMLDLENYEEAKKVFRDFLAKHPNSPMIIAAMGHIELIEGKKADARSRFETALSLTKEQDARVLNAVGHANSNPEMKNGDAYYAIEKLKKAVALKAGAKEPDMWTNLGDAYRKIHDGTNAYQSYQQALAINPNYARAIYRTGRIYQTQGVAQEPIYMKYYNDAIAKDPKYGPVYATLMAYYFETNVAKSAEYMEKLFAVSDNDPKACYYRASMTYAQGLFAEAINKANECIAKDGPRAYPNLFGLKALAYNRLNDTLNAKNMYEEYFKHQIEENIGSGDYATYGTLLLKFPGNEAKAAEYINKAVALDTVESRKVSFLTQMAKAYEAMKDYKSAGMWYSKVLDVKKAFNQIDLYNAGYGYFRAGDYSAALPFFTKYTEKYPAELFGYYMVAKSQGAIDSTGTQGLAVPAYNKVVELGEASPDKAKFVNQLSGAYRYFIQYYYNVKKDQATALQYVDKALLLEPNDPQLIANRDFISKNDPNKKPAPAPKPKPAPKPPVKKPVKKG